MWSQADRVNKGLRAAAPGSALGDDPERESQAELPGEPLNTVQSSLLALITNPERILLGSVSRRAQLEQEVGGKVRERGLIRIITFKVIMQ